METGSFKEALSYADSTLKIDDAIGSKRFKRDALTRLPLIYAALGQKTKALAYQKEYMQLSDSQFFVSDGNSPALFDPAYRLFYGSPFLIGLFVKTVMRPFLSALSPFGNHSQTSS